MKVVIFGNHTCANRGDSAILRGLVAGIEERWPEADIAIKSRFPKSSTFLLGREIGADVFSEWHRDPRRPNGRRKRAALLWAVPLLMAFAIRSGWKWPVKLLPKRLRAEIEILRQYDIAIQVGGSFFVDLYGPAQFEYPFAAILCGRPLLVLGHSMGPFGKRPYRWLVSTLLLHASEVVLREPVTHEMISACELPNDRISMGSDTAWLVDRPVNSIDSSLWLPTYSRDRPLIGITVRDISRFAHRLGTTQSIYEAAFGRLVNEMILRGYDVAAFSTCTPLDGYHSDDGLVARRISASVADPDHFHVAFGEPNDVQLGQLLTSCELLISTRLHGAIIALNFGIPAVAISYEHKSDGVMRQLGLGHLAHSLQSLIDGSITAEALLMLEDSALKPIIATAVEEERKRARTMVETTISRALSK